MESCDGKPALTRRALLGAGAAGAAALAAPVMSAAGPSRGDAVVLPRIELLDGGVIEPADWRGMAAVLVFWITDCAYCQRHNARIDKLHRSAQGSPLRVLGASHDRDAHAVRRYMARNRYAFPVTLQSTELRQRLTERRGVVPLTVTLDRAGRLDEVIPGEMSEVDIMQLLRLAR